MTEPTVPELVFPDQLAKPRLMIEPELTLIEWKPRQTIVFPFWHRFFNGPKTWVVLEPSWRISLTQRTVRIASRPSSTLPRRNH
ncbi:hypothetical protein F2Q70_00022217 [Brassica cretica]|uniref:Uncharacterized protein n=1 Tax=Brassica cretica TaxID=69181 RepID=A0A8S9GY38_BRACR|nr:hypothetical protein F2Q70_00022217 [Brassica cretica]